MKVFNCIFGVFSVIGAVYCIFFPGISFLNAGWIVAILIGIYGTCSIFEYFANPVRKENKDKGFVASGVLGLVVGIAAAVLSFIAMFSTGMRAILDITILFIFVFWLINSGIFGIIGAVKQKKSGGKLWILSLILGIAVIIAGLYGVTHLLFTAVSIGYIIGFELMIYGIRLIMSVFENPEAK